MSHLNKKHLFTVLKILIKEYMCITVICIQMMHGHIATILSKVKFLPEHAVFNSD